MKAILWYNNKKCRISKDEFKILKGSIVSTYWDGVFSIHILDGPYLCECEGGAASYETLANL
jgi:hypothetical protein